MENNDSPYIYEKPLRSKRARRASSLAAIALVGLVGTFGASSIAGSIAASSAAPLTGQASGSVVAVPLQEVKPKLNSVKVNLPVQTAKTYGNTSSATPSAGAYPSNSNSSSKDDEFENEYEDD
jgi:hypothetical protein